MEFSSLLSGTDQVEQVSATRIPILGVPEIVWAKEHCASCYAVFKPMNDNCACRFGRYRKSLRYVELVPGSKPDFDGITYDNTKQEVGFERPPKSFATGRATAACYVTIDLQVK